MRAGRGEQRRTGGLRSRDFELNPNRAGAVENSHINVCGGDPRAMTSDGVSDPVSTGRGEACSSWENSLHMSHVHSCLTATVFILSKERTATVNGQCQGRTVKG